MRYAAPHIAVRSGELLPRLFTLASAGEAVVFCHIDPTVTDSFPLGNMVLCVARTFLSSLIDKMSDRPSGLLYKKVSAADNSPLGIANEAEYEVALCRGLHFGFYACYGFGDIEPRSV